VLDTFVQAASMAAAAAAERPWLLEAVQQAPTSTVHMSSIPQSISV